MLQYKSIMDKKKRVHIHLNNGKNFEGYVVPTNDSSNPEIFVIKLDNGYNLGIDKHKIKKIVEISSENIKPLQKSKMEGNGPLISVLGTGGTISSRVDYVTGGVEASMTADEIFHSVPEALEVANLDFVNVFNKLSEDFVPKNWQVIAREIHSSLKKSEGVVVLHGTDTLHYTSSIISFMINTMKPVVFTGAQRSSDRPSTDSFMNILTSIHVAKSSIPESLVCFHSSMSDDYNNIIRGNRARKMHTSSRDAFKSINMAPLGKVYKTGKIEMSETPIKGQKLKLMNKLEEKVAIIKTYPGADASIIEHFASLGYKGLVIEGTGLGHVPVNPDGMKSWVDAIEKVKDDLEIVITSQTIFGRTHKNVYTNLRKVSKTGAIFVEDMTTETAYAKLMWALGNFKREKVKEIMETNLKGEMSLRTLKDKSQ